MTTDELNDVIGEMRLPKGTSIRVRAESVGAARMYVDAGTLPDSEFDGSTVQVRYDVHLTEDVMQRLTPHDFMRGILQLVLRLAIHEVYEQTRYRGQPLIEPHPEKGWTRGFLSPHRLDHFFTNLAAEPEAAFNTGRSEMDF